MSDTSGPDAMLDKAIGLYRQGKFAEVRSVLRALIEQTPGHVSAWNLLGYLERDVGQAGAAAAAFERALELQP
ncbi:MAG TPA: tetratricopeptide repeat protein, partial [Microvirga sp.]|nr:tetratricopeptide repeat protein [Microvirga sp.]